MSTDLATLSNNLPAHIREQLAAQMAADIGRLGQLGGKDAIRVTQDKKFVLPDGTELTELQAIVVDFVYRNEYYPQQFNKKQPTGPSCFAISAHAASLTPPSQLATKQADSCGTCQWNQYGSATTGSGKACKNTVFLALLPPDATPDSPLWVLKTSATAIRYFNQYVAKVATQAQVPVGAVVTKIFFDPGSTYASLRFAPLGPNEIFAETVVRAEEARKRLTQEPETAPQK